MVTWDRVSTEESGATGPTQAIDWDRRTAGRDKGLLRRIEKLALLAKEPVNKLVGTSQLNPLYYSDTIAFFLLAVVILTGVYVLMFFQYGYDVSYASIESMDRFIVSRVARTVHRYASGGLIIFGTLHAIRMLFMDRFRGARWLGWVAGILTMAVLWLAGVTGYWLLWDHGAQLITEAFVTLLSLAPAMLGSFYFYFLAAAVADSNGWLLMLLIVIIHVGLTVIAGVFYWLHIKRLRRPKFFPPRYWMVGMAALLVIAAVIFPASLLPMADFSVIPASTPLDPMFLFYVPPSLNSGAAALLTLVVILGLTGLAAAVPWLFPRPKVDVIKITNERCTGCTHCVEDCPYGALSMVPRNDDTPFKELAILNPKLCVSCGICIGSCDTLAISMGENKPELLWQDIARRLELAKQNSSGPEQPIKLIFTCERHAAHAGHNYALAADTDPTIKTGDAVVEVMPVTCVAMVNPGLMTHALDAGATEVQVVGCPPNDCTNREGNVWMEERLNRTRAPRLKPKFKEAPIFTTWLAPDHFADALPLHAQSAKAEPQQPPTTFEQVMASFNRRNLILTIILLAVGLLLQVRFTYTPFNSATAEQAAVRVALRLAQPGQLLLEVDGQPAAEGSGQNIFREVLLPPGEHQLRVTLTNGQGQTETPLDETVSLARGQAFVFELDELYVPPPTPDAPEEYDIDTLRNILRE
ncbi:MAG: hypothetical protein Kow0031_06720 [Anaerolineae bacterium]